MVKKKEIGCELGHTGKKFPLFSARQTTFVQTITMPLRRRQVRGASIVNGGQSRADQTGRWLLLLAQMPGEALATLRTEE
jgi:hypothetical protein